MDGEEEQRKPENYAERGKSEGKWYQFGYFQAIKIMILLYNCFYIILNPL